jgi:cell division protein FtsB
MRQGWRRELFAKTKMAKFYKLLQNKWLVSGGALFLLFLVVIEYKQFRMRHTVQQEIADLSRQADQLQKNNQDLQSFVAYLQTDSYKQKAAREQLSMKKDGEVVYSFTDSANADGQVQGTITNQAATTASQNKAESNTRKWWNYLFKTQN